MPLKLKLWRLFLRALRAATWTVDDWIQRQELTLREPAERAEAAKTVDRKASAARERQIRARRPKLPRLRYEAGQFVRGI